MELSIQIYSFVFSFLFGGCLYLLLDAFNKIIKNTKIIIQIFSSFIFIMVLACIYFLGLLFINDGVVHIYFLLCILVGYVFVYKFILPLFTLLRKK